MRELYHEVRGLEKGKNADTERLIEKFIELFKKKKGSLLAILTKQVKGYQESIEENLLRCESISEEKREN